MSDNVKEYVTAQEACKMLQVTKRTLQRHVKEGRLVARRQTGKETLYPYTDVINLQEARHTAKELVTGDTHASSVSVLLSEELRRKDEMFVAARERLAYLQAQFDMAQKQLTDGATYMRQREEALERERRENEEALGKERAAVLELDRSLQEERTQRQAVEARAAALEAKMRELELPWWKKLFRPT